MKFIGQCVVVDKIDKPHGKLRVVKPKQGPWNPMTGLMRIVKGDYVAPAYTPSQAEQSGNTAANDPSLQVQINGSIIENQQRIFMTANLINNNTVSLPFYAHATTNNEVTYETLIGYNQIVNPKSSQVPAQFTSKNISFFFDQAIVDGTLTSILEDTSQTYYIYFFVEDSDGDKLILHKETVNRPTD